MSFLPASSDATLELLAALIRQQIGLDYSDSKKQLMADKLAPLVAERGLDSFLDYIYLLKYSDEAENEWRRVEGALAVHETYFWRERDQFQAAAGLVPALRREHPDRPLRIWHAGCATGEEPYTLAITLAEAGLLFMGPIEILASDLSASAIALARSAVYRPRSLRNLPPDLLQKYFIPISQGEYRLIDPIRSLVRFSRVNLINENEVRSFPACDMIFCRNVFIYFSDDAIQRVSSYFYENLQTPGYLFLGVAESLFRTSTRFQFCEIDGAFCYAKTYPTVNNGSSKELG